MSDTEEKLNWSDLAQTRVGDVEAPPLLPAGHYQALITGQPKADKSSKKQTLYYEFPVRLTEPMDDVDQDALEAAGGLNGKNGEHKLTFYLSPKSLFMFTEFGQGMGASDDLNIPEMAAWLAECGEPLVVTGKHEPNERNPERPFFRIDGAIPLSKFQQ